MRGGGVGRGTRLQSAVAEASVKSVQSGCYFEGFFFIFREPGACAGVFPTELFFISLKYLAVTSGVTSKAAYLILFNYFVS